MRNLNLKTTRVVDGREIMISTVDLCIEHPGHMWYETMIFPAKDGEITDWSELYGERYHTKEEAEEGHRRLCEMPEGELEKELRQ